MKIKEISCLTFILLFSMNALALTIAVDPGHGGEDDGAVRGKHTESEVVLQISKKLTNLLNKDPDFNAFLTRQTNHSLTLYQRVHMAERKRAELFVSIHANASFDPRSKGMEIYFRNELEPDKDALRLANQENQFEPKLIQEKLPPKGDLASIISDLKRNSSLTKSYELSWHLIKNWQVPYSRPRRHAINQGPFRVLQQDEIPSVLVEVGFITNPKELQRLANPEYQMQLAKAIYTGIKDFKETLDKGQAKALK